MELSRPKLPKNIVCEVYETICIGQTTQNAKGFLHSLSSNILLILVDVVLLFSKTVNRKNSSTSGFLYFFYFCVSASLEIPALGLEFHTCA
jgi:hypothetical protein